MLKEILNQNYQHLPINLIQASSALFLALSLSLVLVGTYKFFNRNQNSDRDMFFNLIILPPITCVILMIIGSNLAMSIGLVGSLSIIRFRTAIKSPKDLIFMFWAIMVGLGIGSISYRLTILATFFISATILLYGLFVNKQMTENIKLMLLIMGTGDDGYQKICKQLEQLEIEEFSPLSFEKEGTQWQANLSLPYIEEKKLNSLIKSFDSEGWVEKISLYNKNA